MTEQQIRDGYEQLDSALSPPLDAQDRVAHRVRQRRQRRRARVTVAVAVMVAGGGTAVALASGENGTTPRFAVEPRPGVTSTLVVTRPDGSTQAFPDVTVSCDPPVTAAGDPIDSGRGRIWLYSPIRLEGEVEHEDDAELLQPFVYMEGVVSELQGDRTFSLPVDGPGDSETYPLILFVADTEGGPDGNEVVSSGDSSGTVRVLRAACEPTPVLELEVDATLGSEEGLQSLDLAGSVS